MSKKSKANTTIKQAIKLDPQKSTITKEQDMRSALHFPIVESATEKLQDKGTKKQLVLTEQQIKAIHNFKAIVELQKSALEEIKRNKQDQPGQEVEFQKANIDEVELGLNERINKVNYVIEAYGLGSSWPGGVNPSDKLH